jgi:hypothetical protein
MRNSLELMLELPQAYHYDHTIDGNRNPEIVVPHSERILRSDREGDSEDYFERQDLTQQNTAHRERMRGRAPVSSEADAPRRHDHSSPGTPLTARLVVKTPQTAILETCSRETQGQSHLREPPSDTTRTAPSGAVSPMGAGYLTSGCHSAQSTHPSTPPSCFNVEDQQTKQSSLAPDGSSDRGFSESEPYLPRGSLKAIRHELGFFKNNA